MSALSDGPSAGSGGDVATLRPEGATGKILVADDDALFRKVSRSILEGAGFEVLLAEDGVEALELFREAPEQVAAVVLDIVMPRMDGAEAFREMRRLRPQLPVLFSSGRSEEEGLAGVEDRGHTSFLRKPYPPKTLIGKLRGLLLEATSVS